MATKEESEVREHLRSEVRQLQKENVRLRTALNEAVSYLECNNCHHRKGEYHAINMPCKVITRLSNAAEPTP